MLSTECIRELEYLLAIMTQRLWNLKQLSWHVDAPPATLYRESLATESQITPALWASVQHWRPDAVPPTGRETVFLETGPMDPPSAAQRKESLLHGKRQTIPSVPAMSLVMK
jgi:hypothetical protein